MAEQLPVSAGTVRNRLDRLESRGIIEGYTTHVRYETIGYPLLVVFSCHAPLLERSTYAERAADLPNVVTVRELVTGRYNVRVTAVVSDIDEITAIAMKLDEIGLSIEREELVGHEHRRPFEPFADAITDTM